MNTSSDVPSVPTTEISVDPSTNRKRKIDDILATFDRSKFVPLPPSRRILCAPWDRSSLLSRLCTFRTYSNHSLASPINALTLARKGWTWNRMDLPCVECLNCHQQVCIDLQSRIVGVYAELEKRYAELLKSKHTKACLWSSRECLLTLVRIPIADRQMSIAAFEARKATFESLSIATTTESIEILATPGMTDLDLLALFGWAKTTESGLELVSCDVCQSRTIISDKSDKFALISQHHEYCPWICPLTQGTIPAYEQLFAHIQKANNVTLADSSEANDSSVNSADDSAERARFIRQKLGFS